MHDELRLKIKDIIFKKLLEKKQRKIEKIATAKEKRRNQADGKATAEDDQ